MAKTRDLVKFSTQVDAQLLAQVKALADSQGRKIQSVIEEAFGDLVKRHDTSKPHPLVMDVHKRNMKRFASLYERLAK